MGEVANDKRTGAFSLDNVASVATLMGVAWYAILSLSYARFYGKLGVSPNDVGVSYSTVLANSFGSVFYILIGISGGLGMVYTLQFIARLLNKADRPEAFRIKTYSSPKGALPVLGLIILIFAFTAFPDLSTGAAESVKNGSPTTAFTHLGPIDVLPFRADPVRIESARKKGEYPAIDKLAGRTFLYLGQNNGTAVLYRGDLDQAIFLPMADAVIVSTAVPASSD